MWKLISVSILAMLLCSCTNQYAQKIAERNARIDAQTAEQRSQEQLWEDKFEKLPGTPVGTLARLWGKPEKLGSNDYRWSKRQILRKGGYYESDGHTSSKVYKTTSNGISEHVGYIDTPRERYVEPFTEEMIRCEILISTDKNGRITHASHKSDFALGNRCQNDFPLPGE